MDKNVLVVGAGIGGLTAASLLAKHGAKVTLLESSSELGGCAGKFKRHNYVFPVGATLGMGLEEGGIHERVFRFLQKPLSIEPLERVMQMVHPHDTFTFYKDRAQHVHHMVQHFPQFTAGIKSFYHEIYQTARIVRTLMDRLPVLPPTTAKEWLYLLGSLQPKHIRLLPYFNQTLDKCLRVHGLQDVQEFRQMIDGLLIDSMQTGSEDVSYLLAAVALDIYHEGAYYVPGGVYQFAERMGESLVENGGILRKRRTVSMLERINDMWQATDHRGNTYEATHVILNVPIHQLPNILSPNLLIQLMKPLREGITTPTWTTLTLYIAVNWRKLQSPLPSFRQISLDSAQGLAEGGHFFMSASKPEDILRAPDGIQTITISTHSEAHRWDTKEKYDAVRDELSERMLQAIEKVVPHFRESIVHFETGAPKGWERFTGRPNGHVGGFPQTLKSSLFNSISHRSGLPNFYVCGDHIFPGGGTIGSATSGIHAARSISGERLI
ncbi:phytoene desaturase family protein [Paenisporosarcina sp. TG-14]|uniref:phytoene desaturase family protein n=1 Tax=Paenisporosarcina sp. TG-14 TaxID=1231057 RepID=UPI0003085989|nr:FAD-dependent oxidoreductase [Paenisporosarcina sp. TG-14]